MNRRFVPASLALTLGLLAAATLNLVDERPEAMPLAAAQGSPSQRLPVHDGPAYWIKVQARADGTITVTNACNGITKTYEGVRRPIR